MPNAENIHFYETVYILRSGLSDTDANVIHQKVDNVVSKFHGELKHRDDWGIKELAYPIHKQGAGRFFIIQYIGSGGVVEEIERHFRILDDVIRFITVRLEPDYDYAKVKKQLNTSEEEVKRLREMRKKGPGGPPMRVE